jgi:hypothetical protein
MLSSSSLLLLGFKSERFHATRVGTDTDRCPISRATLRAK